MNSFAGIYADRDRAVFALGRFTGERISAILRLAGRGCCPGRADRRRCHLSPVHPKREEVRADGEAYTRRLRLRCPFGSIGWRLGPS